MTHARIPARRRNPALPKTARTEGAAAGLSGVPLAPAARILHLQRMAGNQAVSQLLSGVSAAGRNQQGGRVVVQRALFLKGEQVRTYDDLPKEAKAYLKKNVQDDFAIRPVIEAMIDDGVNHRLSLELIASEIPKIAELLVGDDPIKGTSPRERVARRIYEDGKQKDILGKQLRTTQGAATVPGRNLRGFNELLSDNPELLRWLNEAGIRIYFSSSQAAGLGGLYTHHDRTVHLDPRVNTSEPGVFLRLMLHEMGHATFQQMLMKQPPTPGELNEDEAAFHRAWRVLRQGDGQYLLGLDLGQGREPSQRQTYQATEFKEFCAESFMHRVKEPDMLNQHVTWINSPRNNVPPNVRDAWRDVLVILDRYERLIMRGA